MSYNEFESYEALKGLENPWDDFEIVHGYNIKDEIKDKENPFFWDKSVEKDFKIKDQFPLPINGNFCKAKYLLLYSNPATEKVKLTEKHKLKLIKCFKLEEDAELVIPNDDWRKWYQKQLDKFYFNKQEKIDFSTDFCFINLFAYQSSNNKFDYNTKDLEKIHSLKTTQFIKKLVNVGKVLGKTVLIMRTSENVWKKYSNSEKDVPYEKLVLEITKIPDDK